MKFNSEECKYIGRCPHKIDRALNDYEFVDCGNVLDVAGELYTEDKLMDKCYSFNRCPFIMWN